MKYAHLLQAFYAEPWHLRPDYWRNFEQLLQCSLTGQEVSAPIQRTAVRSIAHYPQPPQRPIVGPVNQETGEPFVEQMWTAGPVAIIPVHGVLGKHLSRLDLLCGGCDYEHIQQFIDLARGDTSVRVTLFDFASPGGMGRGCEECAEAIAELQRAMPTVAFSESLCCSAAYWLASQCGEIWASPTAQIGNVGTILAGVDTSAAWAKEGLSLELFTSSPLKATGLDGKPWTDADREYLRERMLQMDARIKAGVKAGRGDRLDAASLDGRYFFGDRFPGAPGQSAIDVGMVDFIARDLNEALTALLNASLAPPLAARGAG